MEFNFDVNLIQSQKLILTPKLKQALEILQMSSTDLLEYIEEQMEENPVIEYSEDIDEYEKIDWNQIASRDVHEEEEGNTYSGDDESIKDIADSCLVRDFSLKEHLKLQFHMLRLSDCQLCIGEYLIQNIDEDGYLKVSIAEAAGLLNQSIVKVKSILNLIQGLDPPGVGARSLKECLLIQLKFLEKLTPEVQKVIDEHLDDIAANRMAVIARSLKTDMKTANSICELVRSLEPRPGRAFYRDENTKYLIPDVFVKEINGKLEIMINEDSLPFITLSKYYKKLLLANNDPETLRYIEKKLDSAAWLIKCIEHRKDTIIRITESTVKRQEDFIRYGVKHLKPLTMKEVANDLNIHESTVSRTVNGKYIQCPRGVFEMRFLFSGKLNSGGGREVSARNIKTLIKELILQENKYVPLSDGEIANALIEKGIEISRRTVAKYREETEIPPVRLRKKY